MAARGCYLIPGNGVFPGQRRCREPPRRSHLPPRSRAHQGGASPSCREIPGSPYKASPKLQKRGGRCRPAPAPAPALVGKGQGASLRHQGLGTAVHTSRPLCPWTIRLCPRSAAPGRGVTREGSEVPPARDARLPRRLGRVCSACHSSPGNEPHQLAATWLFEYNYHFVLYTGHESSEQLRAPSRSALTNDG